MVEKEVKGARSLIAAIINNAAVDAVGFRNPNKGGRSEPERHAYTARKFFRKDNQLFRFYCNLISIDPDYLCEKAHKYFKRYDDYGLAR